ncbi:MAG TPA: class I SAM-dependent methyltransferase [Solirubrobacteraceae bacterium]|nr:class I SAM-dependent methyltransferase [Solirubrobacteraceae bacterium]
MLDLQAASIWRDMRTELASAHGDVLDVGAGAQPYRTLLPVGVRYHAIDIVESDAVFGYDLPDTERFEGQRWPVEDGSADLVMATETLEHVPEPAIFLQEARRVLRKGGRLIVTVPFSARWHYVPHDYWRFTPSSLRIMLEAAGFSDVAVYARGNETTVACNKALALILMSLTRNQGRPMRRALAVSMLPLAAVLAFVGQISLRDDGGEDCLGWTAVGT